MAVAAPGDAGAVAGAPLIDGCEPLEPSVEIDLNVSDVAGCHPPPNTSRGPPDYVHACEQREMCSPSVIERMELAPLPH